MARRGGIISGARSISQASRATNGTANGAPGGTGLGQLSPLTRELTTGGAQGYPGGWGQAYGGYLPRPPQVFTDGAFGPFSPILPTPVDASPDGESNPQPRRWQYDVGWNLPTGQPGSEGLKLADFSTLRTLADLYSVARAAIQLRKAEIRGLEWDIAPTSDASKAMRGSPSQMKDFGARRAEAVNFFKRPDPNYWSWNTWIDALLEEVFVFDALSMYMCPKMGTAGSVRRKKGSNGKGLLGSDLDSLWLIDGPTIRPLLGLHGEIPRPPSVAYQQYLYGVPRTDLMSIATGRDIEESGITEAALQPYSSDQLLYLPMVPRAFTPYGFPPIERALVPVMAGLQKQGYQLDFFREGTIPGMFVMPGGANANMTPNQIRELQDALNAIAGDPAWKHKIIVLPADSKVAPQKPAELADQFDEIVMNQVLMAFDVMPMELGIMPRVSATSTMGSGNQMAKATSDIHERKSTKPTLMFLADIFNGILQDICGQKDMQFTFEGLEEDEDEETQTNLIVQQVSYGLRSIDEGREELGLQPWGLPETSDPGWATATGFVPLGQVTAGGQPAPGPQPNALNPAVAPPPGGQPGQQSGGSPQQPQKPGQAPRKPSSSSSDGNAGQSPAHDAAESALNTIESKPRGTSSGNGSSASSTSKKTAGLVIMAADTGAVLLHGGGGQPWNTIQVNLEPDEPVIGGVLRGWYEKSGQPLPDGHVAGTYDDDDCFWVVWEVAKEESINASPTDDQIGHDLTMALYQMDHQVTKSVLADLEIREFQMYSDDDVSIDLVNSFYKNDLMRVDDIIKELNSRYESL